MLGNVAEAEERKRKPAENVDPDGTVWTTKKPVKDARRRRRLALGVSALVIAAVAVLAWVGMMAISFFQDDAPSGPAVNLAEETSQQQQAEQPQADDSGEGGSVGAAVSPSEVTVYNPEGEGDSVAEAPNAVDGDESTTWRTDQYQQQFPAFKSGVGLIAAFDEPIDLAQVDIVADSPGTEVEIRVADSAQPVLSETRTVASGTLEGQRTELTLGEPTSAQYVLVWITALSGEAPQLQSQLAEVSFLPSE